MQAKDKHVEQLESKEAQQEVCYKTRLAQQAAAAETATADLELQLATSREQTDSTQQQVDSLQSQLDHTQTQLQSAQQQNSRLLTNVVAAQREAGELSKQKKLAQTELRQLQQQVSEASGVSLEVQHQLQATQAEHARLVADLRYAFCLFLSKFAPTVCAATLLCCMHAAAFTQTATVFTITSVPNPSVPACTQAMAQTPIISCHVSGVHLSLLPSTKQGRITAHAS